MRLFFLVQRCWVNCNKTMNAPSLSSHSRQKRYFQDSIELLSSMRFAIALLTIICIASVIGTVLKQQEPLNNYINQFGPFWAEVFDVAGLYSVYSAWWFLLILAFLVSAPVCALRAILRRSCAISNIQGKCASAKSPSLSPQSPGPAERLNRAG